MHKASLVVLLFCFFISESSVGAVKSKKKSIRKQRTRKIYEVPVSVPLPPAPKEVGDVAVRYPTKNQVNTMFGIHVVKGSALFTGMQFGHRIARKTPVFLGAEYNFSLYSPGSILGFLGGGWYEYGLEKERGSSLSIGLFAGSGFATDVIATPTTVFLGYLDLAFSQPMDDLFDLRIQLRPGIMYRYIAFMMNLSIAFRFG